jgi:hypothetical protein
VDQEARRRTRTLAVIAAVVVVIAVVGLVYLRGGITNRYTGAVAGTPTPSVESTAIDSYSADPLHEEDKPEGNEVEWISSMPAAVASSVH